MDYASVYFLLSIHEHYLYIVKGRYPTFLSKQVKVALACAALMYKEYTFETMVIHERLVGINKEHSINMKGKFENVINQTLLACKTIVVVYAFSWVVMLQLRLNVGVVVSNVEQHAGYRTLLHDFPKIT